MSDWRCLRIKDDGKVCNKINPIDQVDGEGNQYCSMCLGERMMPKVRVMGEEYIKYRGKPKPKWTCHQVLSLKNEKSCEAKNNYSDDACWACGAARPPYEQVDPVEHPLHYQSKTGLEAIDVIEAFELNFALGNVVKYVLREKGKNGLEDLKKARWYLNREIESREEK